MTVGGDGQPIFRIMTNYDMRTGRRGDRAQVMVMAVVVALSRKAIR